MKKNTDGYSIMSKSLFDKGVSPKCKYCKHGTEALGGETILCPKSGIHDPDFSCGKYKYDPLKREPNRPAPAQTFTDDDFRL